jgi:hypothetical protein
MTSIPLEERLIAGSSRDGEHLRWQRAKNHKGYGRLGVNGRTVGAHRVAYEVWVGPIPDGFDIDHLCGVRDCIEPTHLEAVTHRENLRRAGNPMLKRTHCPQGHPYAGDNLRVTRFGRMCLTCRREQTARYRAKKAANKEAA